jgi:hypothetical protein
MTLTPVNSSGIAAIGHDPVTNTLRVQFTSGATYEYAGVSAEHHTNLIGAKSIGQHFQTHIRCGGFKHTKVG